MEEELQLVKDFIRFAAPSASIIGGVGVGILACATVYYLTLVFRPFRFTFFQQIEWAIRTVSTVHAILITVVSLYMVFFSDLFSDNQSYGPVTLRNTLLSKFTLGVSVGYFFSDLVMIYLCFPDLGGLDYVAHHLLSIVSVSYSMLSGEAQIYTFMVLISEITTPGINLRWYLDKSGTKQSKAYIINGIFVFLSWLVARIILFAFLFLHVYVHFDQVMKMHRFGIGLVIVVPTALSVMNLMWFLKIFKGLKKTLSAKTKTQ